MPKHITQTSLGSQHLPQANLHNYDQKTNRQTIQIDLNEPKNKNKKVNTALLAPIWPYGHEHYCTAKHLQS